MPAALYTQVYGARIRLATDTRKGENLHPLPQLKKWRTGRRNRVLKRIDHFRTIDSILESEVTPNAKLIAIALLRFADKHTGKCFPSMLTLCDVTGIKPTSLKGALALLKKEGLIEWESKVPKNGQSKTNHYNLLFVVWSVCDQTSDQTINRSANQTVDQSKCDHDPYNHKNNNISNGSSDEQPIDKFFKPKPKACSDEQWEKYLTFSRKFLEGRFEELGALAQVKDSKIIASAKALDNLIRVQGFDKKTVKETIEWAVKDSFWSVQVRSLGGLTEKKSNGEMKFNNILATRLRQVRDAG